MTTALVLHRGTERLGRQDLLAMPTPDPTDTHKPVAHAVLVESIVKALDYRKISVVSEEYAATPDGMRIFGALAVDIEHVDTRLVIAFRNSHDKSFSLGLIAGFRVFCCDNLAFHGDFVAIARKHSKHLQIEEVMAVGIDRIQRQFDRVRGTIDVWKNHALPDIHAKEIIYNAFIEDELEAPKHLAKVVHAEYFEPKYPEFEPRTMWSLQNAFTSAFKELEPIPRMKATAKLAPFFERFH